MKKNVRIKFTDVFSGWKPEFSLIYRLLARRYEVELCDVDPDYVVSNGKGHEHFRYPKAIKIASIGENISPDFNLFDYAIGFDHMVFGDRYCRAPLYIDFDGYDQLREQEAPPAPEMLLHRKFCSFVVSNGGGDPARTEFFKRLSKYKHVDSGGRFMNNVGGAVANKLEFCARYKFNIAFENSCHPGYVTEKVMQPLSVWSVPIYYGAQDVEKDFSLECMVRLKDVNDIDALIDEVIELDRNDDLYLEKCTASRFPTNLRYENSLEKFLYSIFDRDCSVARRLSHYGCQPTYRKKLRNLWRAHDFLRDIANAPFAFLRKCKRCLSH